jgi:hypothetical protein
MISDMGKNKFNRGDRVRIVNYGHLMWVSVSQSSLIGSNFPLYKRSGDVNWYDVSDYLIGQEGVVRSVINENQRPLYSLKGPNKTCWYDEGQLELVKADKFDIDNILKIVKIDNDVELEQAISLHLKLRLLVKKDQSLKPLRRHLANLIEEYEGGEG